MNQISILILSMTFGLLIYTLIAKWHLIPYLTTLPRTQAFIPLLFLHSFRYIGMTFLVIAPDVSPVFAYPAAYGDLLAALLALLALIALRYRWKTALTLIWIFNIVGTLDLLNAIFQGLRTTTPSQFGATFFIPILVVPALLVTHWIIFKLLLSNKANT